LTKVHLLFTLSFVQKFQWKGEQMQGKISMDLSFCQSEEGFSLDELVTKLADVFERKAFSELLKLILQLVQEILMYRIFHDKCAMKCGEDGRLLLNGGFKRRIRTSLGEFKMTFWRVKCSKCGKTFAPLQRFIHLGRDQTKTNELEKLVVEAASETNYRRAVKELARDGKLPVSFHTAHDWVVQTNCDEIEISKRVIGSAPIQIMPDGTGFKGAGQDGKARKGDLKVGIGITTKGDVFPLGTWAGTSWEEIGKQWKEREMKFPDGGILICDGELELSEAFADYASEQQRCHWHINRDLYYAMYQDGGKKTDSKPIQDALAEALAIELPQEDFKYVSEKEKDDIEERMEKTELAIEQLIGYFEGHGYDTAATYMRRAKIGMFGYVRRWLKWGLISPRASSMVERVMRELGRRIKKIAYGWSDKGVTKIARIILKRFANAEEWEAYWKKRMNLIGNVVVHIGNYKCFSQNLGQ